MGDWDKEQALQDDPLTDAKTNNDSEQDEISTVPRSSPYLRCAVIPIVLLAIVAAITV